MINRLRLSSLIVVCALMTSCSGSRIAHFEQDETLLVQGKLISVSKVGSYSHLTLRFLFWMQGMANTDAKGFIHATGSVVGGHCILCRAINVKKKYFLLRNSWGKNWGMDGDCKISFSDMTKLLADNGEAVFFRKRHTTVS